MKSALHIGVGSESNWSNWSMRSRKRDSAVSGKWMGMERNVWTWIYNFRMVRYKHQWQSFEYAGSHLKYLVSRPFPLLDFFLSCPTRLWGRTKFAGHRYEFMVRMNVRYSALQGKIYYWNLTDTTMAESRWYLILDTLPSSAFLAPELLWAVNH